METKKIIGYALLAYAAYLVWRTYDRKYSAKPTDDPKVKACEQSVELEAQSAKFGTPELLENFKKTKMQQCLAQ